MYINLPYKKVGLLYGPLPVCELTFRHLLQQFEDGALLDERLCPEEVNGREEVCSGHLLLLQLPEASVQLLLCGGQCQQASRPPGHLLAHQQVPASGIGHRLASLQEPQQGERGEQGQAETNHVLRCC